MCDINIFGIYKPLYITSRHLRNDKLKRHLHDIEDIKEVNISKFQDLCSKKSYYFIMPGCGHPSKMTLTTLKTKGKNGQLHHLCCNICNLLNKRNITYEKFSKTYSDQNIKPLSNLKIRGTPLKYKCPKCEEDTFYKEFRWVLTQLSLGISANGLCKRKCNSIRKRYPNLVPVWDKEKNGVSIYDVQASDKNLSRTKRFFKCYLCNKPIQHPTTPYNIIKNQAKCTKHKFDHHTSFAEQSIYLSFKRGLETFFPFVKVFNKYKYDGTKEFDIFITINIKGNIYKFAIENDSHFHKTRVDQDNNKDKYAQENNIFLIRVREFELKEINLDNQENIINRKSKAKLELNSIICKLINLFTGWLDNLGLKCHLIRDIRANIIAEINNVNVLRDEPIIFQRLSSLGPKKLLKDDIELKVIYDQLRSDMKESLGDYITVNEQGVKRPFICNKCGREWRQTVNVVVQNFSKSITGATGCPTCANKESSMIDKLKSLAYMLYENFYTQVEISIILNRSQATICTWIKDCYDQQHFQAHR